VGLSAKVGVDLIKLDQPIAFDPADQAKIRDMLARYPADQRESAIMPALWLAQERFGFISQDAVDLVARSLDVDSSVVAGVATFYTMYHLEPVGRHVIEVCTNVSCALLGAQQTLEAFERECGCHAGETSGDGEFTLKAVECYGGCGWGPVVAIDGRYREPVRAADVSAIVQEVRMGVRENPG